MTALTYKEQLLHPNWQRRRLERLAVAGWQCGNCGANDITLHVHHPRYFKGRMAWEYTDEELSVLCSLCHTREHTIKEVLDRLLVESSLGNSAPIETVIGLLVGFLEAHPEGSLPDDLGFKTIANLIPDASAHLLRGFVVGALAGVDMHALADLIRDTNSRLGRQPTPLVTEFLSRWPSQGKGS